MRSLAHRALCLLVISTWIPSGDVVSRADGPVDNIAENVRPIPPTGIELSGQTRQQLLGAAQQLTAKVESLSKSSPADRAEILVFARAVRMAVEDGMFYSEKEIEQARELLKLADNRVETLSRGQSGAQLIGATEAAASKPQLVVGGYHSHIDGSIQPYGLVLPAEATLSDKKPRRLDVWLHGRGEKSSEVAFLYQRLHSIGEIAPPDTLVLHPYGRYCNAFKFAGEVDVLEAIDHVKKLFAIDEDRIVIRGFSMGGAGCWQMAVHYPSMWMAATPGAGFSETTEFLRSFQQEDFKPTATQKQLLNWYDCPGWANNLRHLPTVAYSGEIDRQKQAADVMEAAMKQRGLVLNHIIGPQTAHKIHPGSKAEIEKVLTDVAKKGRTRVPTAIDFTTFSLRYANNAWLTLDALEQHWQEARVQAELQSPRAIRLRTQNVSRLTIQLPVDQTVLDRSGPIQITIDGSTVEFAQGSADRALQITLDKSPTGWSHLARNEDSTATLRKKPGLQGPIDDAFLDAFVFVGPEATKLTDSAIDKWVASEFAHAQKEWRRHYRGDVISRTASELSADDIANKNLILFGTPQTNPLIAKLAGQLPVRWQKNEISLGTDTFNSSQYIPALIFPNPLNAKRYVVLNSGFTFREYAYLNNARQVAMLPDWAIIDVTSGSNFQMPGKIAAAGFFNEAWQLK